MAGKTVIKADKRHCQAMKRKRRNKGWFRAGQSGNPAGRPRRTQADMKVKIWCPQCERYEIVPLSVSELFPGLRHRCGMLLGPENRAGIIKEPYRKRESVTELIERLASMHTATNQSATGNVSGNGDTADRVTPNLAGVEEELLAVEIGPGVYKMVRKKDAPPGARRYEEFMNRGAIA